MAVRISKSERRRSERRGYSKFIAEEKERIEKGVYEDVEHAEERLAEYQERIEQIDSECSGDEDKVLDDDRSAPDTEDVYETDEEAQEEDFSSKQEGNEHWRNLREELYEQGNLGARVECQVAEDMASEGIGIRDLIEVIEEYERLEEELWQEFGVE